MVESVKRHLRNESKKTGLDNPKGSRIVSTTTILFTAGFRECSYNSLVEFRLVQLLMTEILDHLYVE